jgi:hypothetical protein
MNGNSPDAKLFRVLSLDGGGAKGFYTLGALKEIEPLVGCRLCQKFDLIYGTSTGAIIAALLGLGKSVDEIEVLYRLRVVEVMGEILPGKKTAALESLAQEVFGEQRFDAFQTDIDIVGTRWEDDRSIIFKLHQKEAKQMPKETPAYVKAKSMLPPELHAILDELLDDYRFAALKHHGLSVASAKVLAELILMGWRCSAPAITT